MFNDKLFNDLLGSSLAFAETLYNEVALERFANRLNGESAGEEVTEFIINAILFDEDNEALNYEYVTHRAAEWLVGLEDLRRYILGLEELKNKTKIKTLLKILDKYIYQEKISPHYDLGTVTRVTFKTQSDIKAFWDDLEKLKERFNTKVAS